MNRARICYVVSSELTVQVFLLEHIRAAAATYEVAVIANASGPGTLRAQGVPVDITPVRLERRIALLADLAALAALARFFRSSKPDLVHSVTPKAGLLAALAGTLSSTPVRIHTFTGQVWATRSGPGRWFLKRMDTITAALCTHVLADSASQRDFLVEEGVVRADKIQVLAKGSVCGVDGARFKPDPGARAKLDLPAGTVVFLYLGRLTRDKGLIDLARAFAQVPEGMLLVVGPDEEDISQEIRAAAGAAASRIRFVGYSDAPERYMAAADVFVLPSYREGFGSSVIEAAACGVPALASRIYGLTDAVVDGETGFLVPPRDAKALAARMRELASDAGLREKLGQAARVRALRDFSAAALTRATLEYYEERLRGLQRRRC